MACSEKIVKHKPVFEVKPVSHNPPGIKDFEIIKPISKGAFGQVYLARRKFSKKLYALKAMKKIDVLNKNMMEQVVVERDALAISSKSVYVVPLYYSFQNKENIFLVMEYMIGGDLKSLLHNVGFFDEDMAKFYIAEGTLALEYLHNHSIHHFDIKPDNMLLSTSGHVKLTDFGLSTLSSGSKPTVFDLVRHNTPFEQFSKDSSKTSHVFWRTPGQLQSLVCKFTFSSPKANQRIEKKRYGRLSSSLYKNMEFEFSTPGRRSYNTTPCGLQRKKSNNLSLNENDSFKLVFPNAGKEEDSFRKIPLVNFNVTREKENIPKRIRSSLPVELESTSDQLKCSNGLLNSSTHGPNHSFTCSDHDLLVQNMSIDRTVSFVNEGNCNNTNMSGVTALSDSSLMSLGSVSDNSATEGVSVAKKRKSLLKENVKWSEDSPQIMPNDEIRFCTPVKNLNFELEEDEEPVLLANVSDESFHLENSATSQDTPSCDVFDMPFRNQTPFRTPKSCVRGKVAVTEKRHIQGTPDYLAPEILMKREFSAPADWWALGICFYEFVTGVPPFNDDTPELVFQHILSHELIWPEDEESLSESTVETIEWLLSPDPADRPVAYEIKQLASFNHFNWDNPHSEPAPFIPQPDDIYDTTYFDAKNQARQFKMSDFRI